MERPEFKQSHDHLFLTLDSLNAVEIDKIPEMFDGLINKVKWGFVLPHSSHAHIWRSKLADAGIEVYYDGKLSESEKQMPYAISSLERDEYAYISVNAAADLHALIAAGKTAKHSKVVVALPPHQPKTLEDQLDKIEEANENLPPEKRYSWVMCDVSDIERTRARGNYTIIATGIYIKGTEPPDVNERMTADEALFKGADYLAVGSAITLAGIGMKEAVKLVLNDVQAA